MNRYRLWHVKLTDGSALNAVRPDGATYDQMLTICREQFGADRVKSIEPHSDAL